MRLLTRMCPHMRGQMAVLRERLAARPSYMRFLIHTVSHMSACACACCRAVRTPCHTPRIHTVSPLYAYACGRPGCGAARTPCHLSRRHVASVASHRNDSACAWSDECIARTPCRTSRINTVCIPYVSACVYSCCWMSRTPCHTSRTQSSTAREGLARCSRQKKR